MRPIPNIPQPGDRVRINSGYFQNFHGEVVAVDAERRIAEVLPLAFVRGTVEVPFAELSPAEPPPELP